MRFNLILALLGCAHAPPDPRPMVPVPTAQSDSALIGKINSAVDSALISRSIPGAAVAVLRHDTLVLSKGYGLADIASRSPVTTRTIFQIASTTKLFTAMAVLLLVEEGKIDLDAPVARYLSWLPAKYSGITVRQLLTHTSGVNPDVRNANIDEMSVDEFKRRLTERPVSFPPGSSVQYANSGFTLLSFVVESASGEQFGQFLQRRIFSPLGLHDTGYRVPLTADGRHAKGYERINGELSEVPQVFSGWGNSGIETTVGDLAKFTTALDRRLLLRPSTYDLMYTPGRLANDSVIRFSANGIPSSFGFAWFIQNYRGAYLLEHGGAVAGFSSQLNRFVRDGWTIIVLSNGKQGADRRGQADAIASVIADVIGIGTSAR
ncbi:MAG: serine hydrolase domain-containing protein [Gemmatimonadaceae bacterium]